MLKKVVVFAPPGPLGVYLEESQRPVIKSIPDPPPKLIEGDFQEGDVLLSIRGKADTCDVYIKDATGLTIDKLESVIQLITSEIEITVLREDGWWFDTTCMDVREHISDDDEESIDSMNVTGHVVHVIAPPGPLGVYLDRSEEDGRPVIRRLEDPPPKLIQGEFQEGDVILSFKGRDDISTIKMKDSRWVSLTDLSAAFRQIKSGIELVLRREDQNNIDKKFGPKNQIITMSYPLTGPTSQVTPSILHECITQRLFPESWE